MSSLFGNISVLLSLIVSSVVIYFAFINRQKKSAVALLGFMSALWIWEFSHLLVHLLPVGIDRYFEKLKWLGIGSIAFFFLYFVLEYIDKRLLTKNRLYLLFAWPLIINLLIWTSEIVGILGFNFLSYVWYSLGNENGILYWSHMTISYIVLGIGTSLLLYNIYISKGIFRKQSLVLFIGICLGWIGSLISQFELFGEYHFHTLTMGLVLTGVLFLSAIIVTDLEYITPIARKKVLETIPSAVLVIDKQKNIIDINKRFKEIFEFKKGEIIGSKLEDILSEKQNITDISDKITNGKVSILEINNRIFKVESTELKDKKNNLVGYVSLFYDITDQKKREEKLEKQNKKLDEFAGILSHDLRNPLNVAQLNLELAKKENPSKNHKQIKENLDRMENMINNLLSLTRQGKTVSDKQKVSIKKIIDSSWNNLETKQTKLEIKTDLGEINADPNMLKRLFSNLLSNAIEHTEPNSKITIGKLKNNKGFYIEDDGPGIKKEKREKIFQKGYSETTKGTGLGLQIVKNIVNAHGWTINITEGKKGGARFEIKKNRKNRKYLRY